MDVPEYVSVHAYKSHEHGDANNNTRVLTFLDVLIFWKVCHRLELDKSETFVDMVRVRPLLRCEPCELDLVFLLDWL